MVNEELAELKRADRLQGLVMQEGWKDFVALCNAKIDDYMNALHSDPLSDKLLDPRKEEQIKGAIYGITFVRDLPSVTIAAMKELRKSRQLDPNED